MYNLPTLTASDSAKEKSKTAKTTGELWVVHTRYYPGAETAQSSNRANSAMFLNTMEATRPPRGIKRAHDEEAGLLITELENLKSLPHNWDTYGAEAPNPLALGSARTILDRCIESGCYPDKITPSVENGVALIFEKGTRYADIECFNTGDIAVMTMDRQAVKGVFQINLEIKEIDWTIDHIFDYING